MKPMFCPKPWENVLVEINGDVYFCCFSSRPGGRLGSLQREGLKEIWEGRTAASIRKNITAGKIPQSCLDCELYRFEKKWILSVRSLYLTSPWLKAALTRSRVLIELKNRLRTFLYNLANLKK